jgi:hypothetical protein
MGRDPVKFPDTSAEDRRRRGSPDPALVVLPRRRGQAAVGAMPEPACSERGC